MDSSPAPHVPPLVGPAATPSQERCMGCSDSILDNLPHRCAGMIYPGNRRDLPQVRCCCPVCNAPSVAQAAHPARGRRR